MRFLPKARPFFLLIIYGGTGAALLMNFILVEPIIFEGAPYEDWDEVMAYNITTPISLTTRFQNTTYGSVEECKFWIAKFVYEHFDPVGRSLSPLRWSNNVLNSYLRPEAVFESNSFDGTYSRGILDRRPFFIARYINFIGATILSAILCGFWLRRFRYHSLFLIVPLLWFTLSDAYVHSVVRAVPNLWNALIAIMVFVALIDAIERRRMLGLYLASGLVALGANTKVDFLLVGASIFATWIVGDFENRGLVKRWVRPALFCVLSFFVVLVMTNPRLLYAAPLVISEQYRLLHSVGSGSANLSYNWVQLINAFVAEGVGAPWNVAKLHSLSIATGAAVCLLFPLALIFSPKLDTRRKCAVLVVLSTFYLFLWLSPLVFADRAYNRYFLSGIAVAMVSIGYACRYFWKENSRLTQLIALLIPCLCVVSYFDRVYEIFPDALDAKELEAGGLDPTISRNQAVLRMVQLIESGNYAKQVIVDQHGYTDVRVFLERGISVTLINAFNYQKEVEGLESVRQPILGLYVPGEGRGTQQYMGQWNEDERSRYETYLRYLSKLETVAKFGFKPMLLLDWAPPDYDSEVVVFEVSSGARLSRATDKPDQ